MIMLHLVDMSDTQGIMYPYDKFSQGERLSVATRGPCQ